MDKVNMFIPIRKIDMERREVWGWGAVEEEDRADEILDYATSKPNFLKWSNEAQKRSGGRSFGNVRSMHGNIAAGKLIDLRADDESKGFYVGAKIVDDNEWKKVVEGVYTGFSVGGSYMKRWPDYNHQGKIRYTAKPSELSIVDAPCIPSATFEMVKADGLSETRSFQPSDGTRLIKIVNTEVDEDAEAGLEDDGNAGVKEMENSEDLEKGGPGSGIKGHTTDRPDEPAKDEGWKDEVRAQEQERMKQFAAQKHHEGDSVKITGNVGGAGKVGRVTQIAPSGQYYGVHDKNNNFIGYYHESDLAAADDDDYDDEVNKLERLVNLADRLEKARSAGGSMEILGVLEKLVAVALDDELRKVDGVPSGPENIADIPLNSEVGPSMTVAQMPAPNSTLELDPNNPASQDQLAGHAVMSKDLSAAFDAWLPKVGVLVKQIVAEELEKGRTTVTTASASKMVKVLKSRKQIDLARKEN